MSEPSEVYQQAKDKIWHTDKVVRIATIAALVACTVVVALATVVIIIGLIRIVDATDRLEHNQIQFHKDTAATLSTVNCQTTALNLVISELAQAQQAQKNHQPLPDFVFPKPC